MTKNALIANCISLRTENTFGKSFDVKRYAENANPNDAIENLKNYVQKFLYLCFVVGRKSLLVLDHTVTRADENFVV